MAKIQEISDNGGSVPAYMKRTDKLAAARGDGASPETFSDLEAPAGLFLGAVNTQTGTSYTAALEDDGKIVEMNNAAANTFYIPENGDAAFEIGTIINVTQLGAGTTTIQAGTAGSPGTVVLNGVTDGSCDIDAQYGGVSLYKRASDTWIVQGAHGGVS